MRKTEQKKGFSVAWRTPSAFNIPFLSFVINMIQTVDAITRVLNVIFVHVGAAAILIAFLLDLAINIYSIYKQRKISADKVGTYKMHMRNSMPMFSLDEFEFGLGYIPL